MWTLKKEPPWPWKETRIMVRPQVMFGAQGSR